MKSALDQPEPGQVVETTTRRRVLPSDPAPSERTTPEFWSYLESLKPVDWPQHILYVYRDDPGPAMQVAKYTFESALADHIPWNDREETEAGFAAKFGGRQFRVIVKRGPQRMTMGRIYVNAPARPLAPSNPDSGAGVMVSPMTEVSATADVAKMAMNQLANQERDAVNIGVNALASAARVIQEFAGGARPGQQDPLMQQLMAALIERAFNPPDPFESLSKVLTVMNTLNPQGGAGGANPLVTQIMETGLKRLLEPPASGAPAVSASAELVRTLPNIAMSITDGLREWRMGMEAQRDGVAIMRQGQPQPGAPAPAQHPAQTAVLSPHAPAPNPTAPPAANGAPSMQSIEFVESKIVEIFNEPVGAEQIADDMLHFLSVMDSKLADQLASQGETGLVQLFHTRPILKRATANMPRLIEVIREFLRLYQEDKKAQSEEPQKAN